MNGKDSKRSKGRRTLSSHSKNSAHSTHLSGVPPSTNGATAGAMGGATAPPLQPFGSKLTMNVCDVATEFGLNLKPSVDEAELTKVTELIDAPLDMNIPPHAIGRGQNPYLEQCMYCSTPRSEAQDGDEGLELLDLQLDGNAVISGSADTQSFSSLKLEIWTCSKCRQMAGSNFQTFLEANLPQPAYELPSFLHDREACVDTMSCFKCQEELSNHERETKELQENWVELRSVVADIYACETEPSLCEEEGERLKYLVDKLCSRDPHQLFLRLESQAREVVTGIKKQLLSMLEEYPQDCPATPQQALAFTSALLGHHELLTKKAHLLALFLGGMSEHLKRFKVTWELLNKHLFHSIVHTDLNISNCGPTILEHLRQGSVMQEKSKDDPYCVVRKELLKFQNEMAVVVVVWRDCQQLIENYCQEEVKNTQKQVQILKEHLIKEPFMDEALSNLISGHKSSAERVMCHRCKRERCTCDECTITHMITCGNVTASGSDGGGDKPGELNPHAPNAFNFTFDRNVMDINPPSMSSTTSSSGSVSPINIEDKLTTFYDCEKEEFSEAFLTPLAGECHGIPGTTSDDIDENAGDDEDEDDDEEPCSFADTQDVECDEPHSLQVPIIDAEAALWEAVQQQQHALFAQGVNSTQHNCAQCHQGTHQCVFQPRIDPDLSRQLDAELAKNGLLPSGDCPGGGEESLPSKDMNGVMGEGDGGSPPGGLRTACQCHACLKQSGQIISTSLPLQVPVSPPPAELHLYPHIHGLPQQHPQRYMALDLNSPLMPPIKLPVKLDFTDPSELQDHIYHAYSDWDNSLQPRPGSLAAQHQHQHQQRLSAALSPDLLPPAPLTSPGAFSLDSLSLATHITHTATTNTDASAFKSVAGKHLPASVLPAFNSLGASFLTTSTSSEGSSVDPSKAAAAALEFASLANLPVSCLNGSSGPLPHAFSGSSSLGTSLSSSTTCSPSKANGSGHGPPCSRPTPVGGNAASSKWERNHPQHCKKLVGMAGLEQQSPPGSHLVHPFTATPQGNSPTLPPSQAAAFKNLLPSGGAGTHYREDIFKSFRSTLPCSHSANPSALKNPGSASSYSLPTPPHPSPLPVASSANNVPAVVNTVGVGTTSAVPLCGEHGFEGHHHPEDNCDSIDDSCSEKSSTASSNNQKEGKYCDCCYCEFFGHNNTQVAKTSTNYAQMKDRLQKKLKKRQTEKHKSPTNSPKNGLVQVTTTEHEEKKDPLEKKGLEGLLSFINGTEDSSGQEGGGGPQHSKDKELTVKAAKRARQKQRKLEEKAKQEKNNLSEKLCNPAAPSDNKNCPHYLIQALKASVDVDQSMVRPKFKKVEDKSRVTEASSLTCSQEIPRSSLIIESTRPTISRASKETSDKVGLVTSQPKNGMATKGAHSQQMMHILQTIKQQQQHHHHHQQQLKTSSSPSTSSLAPSTKVIPQAKSNGEVKTSNTSSKSNPSYKENNKDSVSASKNQRTAQPSPKPLSNKTVNGKIPILAHQSNATKGKSGAAEKQPPQASSQVTPQQSVPNGTVKNGSHSASKGSQGKGSTSVPASSAPAVVSPSVSSSKSSVTDSPGASSTSSASSQSPSCGSKPTEQTKPPGKAKKNKKKNKNSDLSCVDEIFMPKPEGELDGDVDDFERELEEFKRFCFEPADIKERRKLAVNVNLKDIFKKKNAVV